LRIFNKKNVPGNWDPRQGVELFTSFETFPRWQAIFFFTIFISINSKFQAPIFFLYVFFFFIFLLLPCADNLTHPEFRQAVRKQGVLFSSVGDTVVKVNIEQNAAPAFQNSRWVKLSAHGSKSKFSDNRSLEGAFHGALRFLSR
jgi:hypothetical protein